MKLPPALEDPTLLVDARTAEVIDLLSAVAQPPIQKEVVGLANDVLVDRSIRLLRTGSRQQLAAEASALYGFLESTEAAQLRATAPVVAAQWQILAELVAAAARKSDEHALEAVFAGLEGLGERLVELLVASGGSSSRARLRERLGLSESHLSHLLRDLEEADVIVRYRPNGGKEVYVALGPAGKSVASQIYPEWVDKLTAELQREGSGEPRDADVIAAELLDAGLMPRLAAQKLAACVVDLGRGTGASAASTSQPARLEEFLPEIAIEDARVDQTIKGDLAQIPSAPGEMREVFDGLTRGPFRLVSVSPFRPADLKDHLVVTFKPQDAAAGHFCLAEMAVRNPRRFEPLKIYESEGEVRFLFPRASAKRGFWRIRGRAAEANAGTAEPRQTDVEDNG